MAAELLLTFAVEESLRRMISIAAEGIGLAWGLNGQLQNLVDSLTMIRAVLRDAATRPATEDGVKRWLDKLQDVAHDAEDVLDEFDYEQKGKRIHGALDEILKLGGDLGLANRPEVRRDPPRQTDSFLDSSADTSAVVVGREDDVSKVVEWLTRMTKSQHVLSVVPIVWMAGLGKTTIAKNVYKEVKERKLFDETIWVCVSNHFDEVKILREMLQTIDKTTGALENIDAILQNLKKQLEDKTFLLVLDDVWNRNRNKWNGLKDGVVKKLKAKNGNAVVVTTRIKEVASMMETSHGIQLEPEKLSDDECWSIIKQKVSGEPDSAVDGASHVLHLNLISCGHVESTFQAVDARKLRTVFSMVDVLKNQSWKFKSLRTLKLQRSNITKLQDSICKLRHLRYLDVSQTNIKALPESITKLYHLETLRFTDCFRLQKLPKKMRNLVSLRHLHFNDKNLVPADVSFLTRLQTLPIFVVGPDHKIEELRCLNELRGELEIWCLERVRDREDAEKAKLREKRMNKLVFKWSDEGNSSVNIEDVLDALQPHPDIRSLTIEGYCGEKFPSWMSMLQLNNLMVLRLKDCSNCRQLPILGCFSRLEILEMSGMPNVICIGNEFYSSSGSEEVLFPALKELRLLGLDGLEEWMVPCGEGDQVFPCLEKLSIEWCGKLTSIPICGLSSLVEFEIAGCEELRYLSGEFHGFTSLQFLSIEDCPKLASIPSVQHCTALVKLDIDGCPELISIPGDFQELKYSLKILSMYNLKLGALPSGLQCCTSLEELYIWDCRELIHISDLQELSFLRRLEIRDDDCLGGLTQLKELAIGGFSEELEAFPIGVLNSFQHLNLSGWDKLKSIPHQLQHLTALERLEICDFRGEGFEEALPDWLANLSSLRYLGIDNCKNLKYLPSSTTIQRLSKLKGLRVLGGCPHLSENCRKENGCEWPKISHVPTIDIV
uniref:Putative disease resistance protein RGA4 n=1 Tax=Populus alba TaxID=43335 RepID=A0A4U5NPT2_POPAL|nr:putative disease resistance protein RGA4 [Populus alba]